MKNIESLIVRQLHLVSAGIIAGSLLLAMVTVMPFMRVPAYPVPWTQAIHMAGVFMLGSQIALFLSLQVIAGAPTRALAWLAGSYAAVAVYAAGMMVTFPGLIDEIPGATQARDQASTALWILGHIVQPAFVMIALVARRQIAQPAVFHFGTERLLDLFPVGLGIAVAGLTTAWCIENNALLPELIAGDDYRQLATHPAALLIIAVDLAALAAIVRETRLREVLYLWLALAMFTLLLESIVYLASYERYTVGWYVSRALGLFSLAALMFGLMVEHFRLHRDAEIRAAYHEQAAAHDPLTGLFNRRYLQDKLPEELARASRYRYPLSLLLLDIDHFKRINDEHGHGIGDQCLRAMATLLHTRVGRSGDFSARYGGEEFVVVLPETGERGALEVAEEIRRATAALHAQGRSPRPMTISIGVATQTMDGTDSAEQLLTTADRYLYRAKANGRNRVEWPGTSRPEVMQGQPGPA